MLGRVSNQCNRYPPDIIPGTGVNPMEPTGMAWVLDSDLPPFLSRMLGTDGSLVAQWSSNRNRGVLKSLKRTPAPKGGGGGLSHDSLSETWSKRTQIALSRDSLSETWSKPTQIAHGKLLLLLSEEWIIDVEKRVLE